MYLKGVFHETYAGSSRSYELEEAKRWFEAATVICRFVPGGKDRAVKVRDPVWAYLRNTTNMSPRFRRRILDFWSVTNALRRRDCSCTCFVSGLALVDLFSAALSLWL